MRADAGCRAAGRAPCCPSRGRHWATSLVSGSAMRRYWRSCVSSRASIRRYGYRKIRVFLARRGHPMSAQRAYRLWHQAGLHVPRRRPRRRVASRRARPLAPTAMNHVWAYDFVFDTCADGRSLKCLTVVDEFTRECLAIDVAGSIRSGRVIDVLGQLVSLHGTPRSLRSENGPEFIATALLRWLQTAEIDTAFIDPGKPWQNGTDESFNGEVPERMSIPRVVSESDGGQDRGLYPDFPKSTNTLYLYILRAKLSVRPAQVDGIYVNIISHGSTPARTRACSDTTPRPDALYRALSRLDAVSDQAHVNVTHCQI